MKFFNKFTKLDYFIAWVVFFVTVMILSFFFEYKRDQKLKFSTQTEAVLTEMGKSIHYGTYANIEYHVKNEKVTSRLHCNCPELEVGDTILIKYSLESPSTTALVKKFYMEKFKKK